MLKLPLFAVVAFAAYPAADADAVKLHFISQGMPADDKAVQDAAVFYFGTLVSGIKFRQKFISGE